MRPLNQLRGAIVGFGSIGRRHCENLIKLGVNDLVVVRRPKGPNPAFQPPATARVVHGDAEAIAAGLDFAVICTPTRLHVEMAKHYLDAGVAVLVEKPICDRVEDAQQLVDAARSRGVLGCVAYSTRYHAAYAAARKAVASGHIGRTLYTKSWFEGYLPAWHPWEDYRQSYAAQKDLGGGVLRTLDHDVDYLNWCFGAPGAAIGGIVHTGGIDIDADDHASLLIQYPQGPLASVSLSLCRRDRSRGFEFIGERGTLAYNWNDEQLRLMSGNDDASVLLDYRGHDFADMYVDMVKDFVSVVAGNGGTDALAGFECGLSALEVSCRSESHSLPLHRA